MRTVVCRGFTLAEVMLSIGVFSIAFLAVVGLLVSNFSLQAKSDEVVSATHIAESVLDEWKSRPYSEIAARVGQPPVLNTKLLGGSSYECAFTTETLPGTTLNPGADVLIVKVQVEWIEKTQLTNTGTRGERVSQLQLRSVVTPGASL